MLFSKMHGLGNDFILLNGFKYEIPAAAPTLAIAACNRKFGIGADGLIILSPSKNADINFRIYNSDGSEAEMCGNGIRCAAVFARDEGICQNKEIRFETPAGEVITRLIDENKSDKNKNDDNKNCENKNAENKKGENKNLVKVNMGKPRFLPEEIPACFPGERVVSHPLKIGEEIFKITLVSMGNPHCIIFVDSVLNFPVGKIGPQIEEDSHFPAKTNVEFVEVINKGQIRMRVWERGCGETLACGTGACAAAVAAVLNGHCNRELEIELKGGLLKIKWLEDNSLEMTGPAVRVFKGDYAV